MHAVLDDVRHSVRALRNAPRFTFVVASVLALGIGATTSIFSVLSAVLLRPVPFPDGHRVVSLALNYGDYVSPNLTSAKLLYWQERTRSFAAMASWQSFLGRVGEAGDVTGARGLRVTAGFFNVLGLPPRVGRVFAEEEYRPGGPGSLWCLPTSGASTSAIRSMCPGASRSGWRKCGTRSSLKATRSDRVSTSADWATCTDTPPSKGL